MTKVIYRLMSQQGWSAAKKAGVFYGTADDRRDGYIHFSTAKTVRETAGRYYADVQSLMLISAQADHFGNALRWEPSRRGILFPHLYGPLDTSLVIDAVLLERTPDGHSFGKPIA